MKTTMLIDDFESCDFYGVDVCISKIATSFHESPVLGKRVATRRDMSYIEDISRGQLGNCYIWLQDAVASGNEKAARFVHFGCGGSCNYGWSWKENHICKIVLLSQTTDYIHGVWKQCKPNKDIPI